MVFEIGLLIYGLLVLLTGLFGGVRFWRCVVWVIWWFYYYLLVISGCGLAVVGLCGLLFAYLHCVLVGWVVCAIVLS